MSSIQHPSYGAWEEAFGDLYDALPDDPHLACPICGKDALRIAFVADPGTRLGWAYLWCDACHHGITRSRTLAPDAATIVDRNLPAEERLAAVPDFTIVYPPSQEVAEDDDELYAGDDS